MHDRDALAAMAQRVFEGVLRDPPAASAGVDPGADRDGMRIVADRHVVLERDVQTFEVLADQHQVDILVAPAGQDGSPATV